MYQPTNEEAVLSAPAISPASSSPRTWLASLRPDVGRLRSHLWLAAVFIITGIVLYVLIEYKLALFSAYLSSSADWWWKAYSVLTSLFLVSRFVLLEFYRDDHQVEYSDAEYPGVSFVIAAKNEVHGIQRTINTCLASDYPGAMECVVVNDGSTDSTGQEIAGAERHWSKNKVNVITFANNRGKREAMAEGVLAARHEIIVFVDSDSYVQPTAVKTLVEHFLSSPKVGAVTGETGVENKNANILTRMESARYGVSYNIFKSAESVFGTVSCCSGCFSAYRKNAILAVLPRWRNQKFFGSPSTFGDDRSLTNFILRSWEVVYCRTAKATTMVPEKFRVFLKQQLRWKKSWIREGAVASTIMWRKHPLAALSFYTQLLLPVFGPFIAFNALVYHPIMVGIFPYMYLIGVLTMSLVFGLTYYRLSRNTNWMYIGVFSLLYVFVLVWQMPLAVLKIMDTGWSTR